MTNRLHTIDFLFNVLLSALVIFLRVVCSDFDDGFFGANLLYITDLDVNTTKAFKSNVIPFFILACVSKNAKWLSQHSTSTPTIQTSIYIYILKPTCLVRNLHSFGMKCKAISSKYSCKIWCWMCYSQLIIRFNFP